MLHVLIVSERQVLLKLVYFFHLAVVKLGEEMSVGEARLIFQEVLLNRQKHIWDVDQAALDV